MYRSISLTRWYCIALKTRHIRARHTSQLCGLCSVSSLTECLQINNMTVKYIILQFRRLCLNTHVCAVTLKSRSRDVYASVRHCRGPLKQYVLSRRRTDTKPKLSTSQKIIGLPTANGLEQDILALKLASPPSRLQGVWRQHQGHVTTFRPSTSDANVYTSISASRSSIRTWQTMRLLHVRCFELHRAILCVYFHWVP